MRPIEVLCLQSTNEYYTKSVYVQAAVLGKGGHRTREFWHSTKVLKINYAVISCWELATVWAYLSLSSLGEVTLSIPILKQGLPFSRETVATEWDCKNLFISQMCIQPSSLWSTVLGSMGGYKDVFKTAPVSRSLKWMSNETTIYFSLNVPEFINTWNSYSTIRKRMPNHLAKKNPHWYV